MGLEALREALPAARACTFLNYAATAPLLAPAAAVMARLAEEATEPPQRHFNAWLAHLEQARAAVAELVGTRPEAVAFTTNTSSALSLIAGAIRWQAGDRVLYPAEEFPSNRYVWQNLADRGVRAEALTLPAGASLAEVLDRMDLAGVRAVACSAVSYRDGRREDVAAVAARCRPRGILLVVDAIQAVGAVPVDMVAWDCDMLACGGQKWLLGPVGSGFLAIRPALIETLHVPLVGWVSSRDAGDMLADRLDFADGARRFEPGLPDVPSVAALAASIATLGAAGWPEVFARIAAHNVRLRRECAALGYPIRHDGPPETQAGIVTLSISSPEATEALGHRLAAADIVVTYRLGEVRLAAHATTTDADLDRALALLDEARPPTLRPATAAGSSAPAPRSVPASVPAPGGRRSAPAWRQALVTGASGGLGEGIAAALARRGCALTLLGRDEAALAAVAGRLEAEHGIVATWVAVDLADGAALGAWIAAQQARLATCDVLVNCAAEAEAGRFDELGVEGLRRSLDVNVLAPVQLAQALVPAMVDRGRGAVLNVVTTGARNALPLFGTYAAGKAALWAWSEGLTRELAGSGVTVTTFLPPRMDSRTSRRLARHALAYYRFGDTGRVGRGGSASAFAVGQAAVAALAAGRDMVLPWRARLQIGLNALAPGLVAWRVARQWRGRRGGE